MARPRKNQEGQGPQIETHAAAEIAAPQTEKKKGTKPGWRPAGQLPGLKAPHGFTAKWANPEKIDKLLAEGWIVMKPEDNRGSPILRVDVNDGNSLTGALRYRELIAVMLPTEMKEARDEWIRNENREATRGILRETDEKMTDMGVQTFTPKGQAGRIVID